MMWLGAFALMACLGGAAAVVSCGSSGSSLEDACTKICNCESASASLSGGNCVDECVSGASSSGPSNLSQCEACVNGTSNCTDLSTCLASSACNTSN